MAISEPDRAKQDRRRINAYRQMSSHADLDAIPIPRRDFDRDSAGVRVVKFPSGEPHIN